jgi:WD40 repeat protein
MIRIAAMVSGVCFLVMGFLSTARTACASESDTIYWSGSRAGTEQVFGDVPPVSRISWSPDAKNLVLVTADGSLWIIKPAEYKHPKRLTGPIKSLGAVLWSPDGRWLVVEGGRPSDNRPDYPWGTLWLLDPEGKSPRKDLLPAGSPFKTPGTRWIGNTKWLDNDRVFFSMACGTSCLGHYSIDVKNGSYQIFCIGSGDIQWAPDRKIGVAENYSNGVSRQGLGLVTVNSGVTLTAGSTPFQYDRECKSVFSGSGRPNDPAEFPAFITWLPDSRMVLYSNSTDKSLRLWDTQTGQRTTLISGQSP